MTQLYKKEFQTLFIILFFKLLILSFIPLTGDEAYFIKWGQNLSSGYYDHPPIVGWLIYLMSYASENYIFFRLFAFFTTLTTAFVIYKIAITYKVEKEKALFTSLIFLISPIDILLSLMTNDVALLFFGSLGTLFLIYSLEKKEWLRDSALAGVFLGLAFLSKYFAAFLMISLLIFALSVYKTKAIKNVLLITFIISLFIAQNLYFNYNSCWNNILFNFFARTEHNSYNIKTVLTYFVLTAYIFTPWGVYYLFKARFKNSKLLKLLLSILALAFFIFFAVSLKNKVGLHWFLLFTPFMYLLFTFTDKDTLKKLFKYNARFTYIHIAILMFAILTPKSLLENHKKYSDILLYTNPQEVCKVIDKMKDQRIFTFSYSSASVLNYHCKKEITVLFSKSKYGRMDDKLLDVRELSGKTITLFNKKPISEDKVKGVCKDFSSNLIDIQGAKFYVAECKKFNYELYKKNYLDYQNEKFYNIPSWLPVGKCYFKDRYYNGEKK